MNLTETFPAKIGTARISSLSQIHENKRLDFKNMNIMSIKDFNLRSDEKAENMNALIKRDSHERLVSGVKFT